MGPEESIFLWDHKATKDLKNDNYEIKKLRNEIYKKFNGDFDELLEEASDRGGWIYTDFASHGGRFLPWKEGINTSQFIGTFSADVLYDKVYDVFIFVVRDSKSKKSLYLRMGENVERDPDERTPDGNTYQWYIWIEPASNFQNFNK